MLRWTRRWWHQPDQFAWFSAYLRDRGLQVVWRRATFGFTLVLAGLPVVMMASPAGPHDPAGRTIAGLAAGIAAAAAVPWLIGWPSRGQSVLFACASTTAIAGSCLALSNPYTGLMGCAVFAVIGGFVAYFHTLAVVVVNFAVAMVSAAVLTWRLATSTGDVALAAAAVVTVMALNVGVPFGIQSMVHALRADLRDSDNDFLTGLLNRRAFHHRACDLVTDRRAEGDVLVTVTLIDLDDFKRLNDTRGHAAGDAALATVGALLRAHGPSAGLAGRFGGEEFVVIEVRDVDGAPAGRDPAAAAADAAETLRMAIAANAAPVTASIGIAGVTLARGDARSATDLIDDLVRRSDTAMYEAKRAGGNRVQRAVGGPRTVREQQTGQDGTWSG